MISFLKSKLKLAVSLLVSLVLLSSPIIAKAAPNNFGMPPGFDWKAERERELKLFDELDKKVRAKAKQQNRNANFYLNPICNNDSEYRNQIEYKSEICLSGGSDDDSWSDDKRPFPNSTLPGYVLATKDGTIESGSSFIGHAGLVFDHTQTVESSPWKGGVYKGDSDDWMGAGILSNTAGKRKHYTYCFLIPHAQISGIKLHQQQIGHTRKSVVPITGTI